MSKEMPADVAAANTDDPVMVPDEKAYNTRPYAGDGHVPKDFREQSFMTRNGLNLESFQRRKWSSP